MEGLATVLAVVGLGGLAVWLLTRGQPAAPAAPAPATASGVTDKAVAVVATAIFHPNVINHAVFGVGTDSFKTFGEQGDFDKLAQNMCNCYRGNSAACAAALEQAPGLPNCRPGTGDCDCSPKNLGAGKMSFKTRNDHSGNLITSYGPKVPVGGCRPFNMGGYDNSADRESNIAGGYCAGLV